MRNDLAEIERRLVEAAGRIDRQRELVVSMGERGFSTDAPLQILSHMLNHLRTLEDLRREALRAKPGTNMDCLA